MKIYHNPRCTKSRETLSLLREKGIEPEIIEYLEKTPSKEELKQLLKKLKMKAEDLVRKNELVYKEKFKGKNFTEDEWLEILASNPVLIERPVVVKGNKAIIGRPPQNVLDLM